MADFVRFESGKKKEKVKWSKASMPRVLVAHKTFFQSPLFQVTNKVPVASLTTLLNPASSSAGARCRIT
jgi:hypothetical protein